MSSLNLFDYFDDKLYGIVKDLPLSSLGTVISHQMDILLNPMKISGNDWRMLAENMGYGYSVIRMIMSSKKENFKTLLDKCKKKPENTVGKLIDILHKLGRKDVLEVIMSCQRDIKLPDNLNRRIPPCVFVTYDNDNSHIQQVAVLLKTLNKNGILTFADEKSEPTMPIPIPLKTKWRYYRADFILVCVSQTYDKATTELKSGKDVNTAGIYRLMQEEHKIFKAKRFLPVLLKDTEDQVPDWIEEENNSYQWPEEYVQLIKHIKSCKK